jgi:hypothetical protein
MKISVTLSSIVFPLVTATLLMCGMPAQGENWVPSIRDGIGENEPLCRALVKRMKSYSGRHSPDTRCSSWDMISSYPKFTEPPWKELDPRKHRALLVDLLKGDYGDASSLPESEKQKRDARFSKEADKFIRQGGQLRVWRTKLALFNGSDGETSISASEEQTFVEKVPGPDYGNPSTFCVGTLHPSPNWSTRIVLSDLSGLDPRFLLNNQSKMNKDAFLIYTNALFIYEGKPILVGSQSIWTFSSGSLSEMCSFK